MLRLAEVAAAPLPQGPITAGGGPGVHRAPEHSPPRTTALRTAGGSLTHEPLRRSPRLGGEVPS